MEGVIGFVTMFAGNFAPKNWALCLGQILPISQNTALFSILGTTYGGNGQTTFALPDLRGRTVVGAGQGPGLSQYDLGALAGGELTHLTSNQMPAHTHPLNLTITPVASGTATTSDPTNAVYASTNNDLMYGSTPDFQTAPFEIAITTSVVGQQQPFSTLHPVMGMNYIICMYGVYPQRN